VFRVDFFKIGNVFYIFEDLLYNVFRISGWFKGDKMLFEFVFGYVVVLQHQCISVHYSESFREDVFGIYKGWHSIILLTEII
jgi:hypothetical protein